MLNSPRQPVKNAIVSLLIDRGADVHLAIDGDGNTIIAAAHGGSVDIAKLIVNAGADVNDGVPGDGNALIIAVRQGNRPMLEYLLTQGADPTA
jgi:ankyrin repeat protein